LKNKNRNKIFIISLISCIIAMVITRLVLYAFDVQISKSVVLYIVCFFGGVLLTSIIYEVYIKHTKE